MSDVIDKRQRAKTYREEAEKLAVEAKKAFDLWQSKARQAEAKSDLAGRLELAADMIEEANEIAAGMRPMPVSADAPSGIPGFEGTQEALDRLGGKS